MEDRKCRKTYVVTTLFVLWTILSSSDVLVRGQNNAADPEMFDPANQTSNSSIADNVTGDSVTAQSSNTIQDKIVTSNVTTATTQSSASVTNEVNGSASENAAQPGGEAGITVTSQNIATSPPSSNPTDIGGGADGAADGTAVYNTSLVVNDTSPAVNVTSSAENVTVSPAENVTNPAGNVTVSPAVNVTVSPAENVTVSPAENVTVSPAENVTNPVGNVTVNPAENVTSPALNVTSPAENITSPAENVTSPAENATIPLPTENTTTSAENATILTEDVAENITTERENVTSPVVNATTEMTNGTSLTENVTVPETTSEPAPSPTPDGDRNVTTDSESEPILSTESTNVTTEATSTTPSKPQSVTNVSFEIYGHVIRPGVEKADFAVLDPSSNKPCLLASLNITFHFKYRVQEGLIRETYDTVSRQSANDDSSFTGVCEDSVATLSISWNNNTFTLNLTFVLHTEGSTDGIEMDVLPTSRELPANVTWTLHQVVLSYDTANQNIFPGALNPSQQTVPTVNNLNLFKTPFGMSYMCQTPEAVSIQLKDVDLVFNFVHLLPFGVETNYFTNDTVVCSGDLSTAPSQQESLTTPLIVAAALASVVVVIILGYAIQRAVTRHLRQSAYKQME